MSKLIHLGTGAKNSKVDISRAFRQLRVDPKDIDLPETKCNSNFLDLSIPFGFRGGSGFFWRCSNSIRYIMSNNGNPGLIIFFDNLIQCYLPYKIDHLYQFLLNLLQQLGLPISHNRLVPPTISAVCLGILVDIVARTISVPPEKLKKYVEMCHHLTYKQYCTKQELQSLLGILLYN